MQHNNHIHNLSRRVWMFTVLLVIASVLMVACASTPQTKVYRVGILSGLDFFADTTDGFKTKMTELGYIEGKNIQYDLQKTNLDPVAEKQILSKFVADKVDLILVFPTEASIEAKQVVEGSNIPVVFAQAFIEQGGLVNSVREPGGNITGVRFPGPDLAVKRFEVLQQIAPHAKRLWVPYLKGYPNIPPQLEALRAAAAPAGITLVEAPFSSGEELQADLNARNTAADLGFDAIIMLAEPLTVTIATVEPIAKFATAHNLPLGGTLITTDGFSTLFGVMVDNVAVGKQAAPLADKILQGTAAGTIPVASPESFIRINYKAVQSLKLNVPDSLLRQATEIIR